MSYVHQGDVIRLANSSGCVIVLSKDFFNRSGMAVVCPFVQSAPVDALHIVVKTQTIEGIVLLENLRSLDLSVRHYSVLGNSGFSQIQELSDAAQGIFDYYPFGVL